MNPVSMIPTVSAGFSHLDVELAALLRRHAEPAGVDTAHLAWWCAALALTSRAHGCGHSCLELPLADQAARSVDLMLAADVASGSGPSMVAKADRQLALRAFMATWASCPLPPMPSAVRASGLIVLDGQRLYLGRLWASECRVAQNLAARTLPAQAADAQASCAAPGIRALSEEQRQEARKWLDVSLPALDQSPSTDQQQACLQALESGLTVITGGPGTGKTHTAARLLALIQRMRPQGSPFQRIALAAPTGKAAARLREAMDQAWSSLPSEGGHPNFWEEARAAMSPPQTVHALLSGWRKDQRAGVRSGLVWNHLQDATGGVPSSKASRAPQDSDDCTPHPAHSPAPAAPSQLPKLPHLPPAPHIPVDTLLVDEASMLDLSLLDELLQALSPQARLVLIGDRHQLSSVEAGAVMADICEALQGQPALAPLRHSRRFQGTIGRWASGVQQADEGVLAELVAAVQTSRDALIDLACGPEGWQPFAQRLQALGEDDPMESGRLGEALATLDAFRVLAAVRQGPWGVEGLNESIECGLAASGHLQRSVSWPHGQVRMILRNDESSGLRNGDVGVVFKPRGAQHAQFAWLSGGGVRRIGVARLPESEPAYAMTVHKSQGSEFSHVAIALPEQDTPVLTRELLYTALTRARRTVSWFGMEPNLLRMAAKSETQRMSGLSIRLSNAAYSMNRSGENL